MGIEFRESTFVLSPKAITSVEKGQVYNINMGFSGLKEGKDGQEYAFFLGDTVLVGEVCTMCLLLLF